MKPYYYVFKPVGHPPSRKHDTLEDAIKESQRLCEIHPNQTFEVLQCVAITSAPKPQVSTFYMDGFAPKSNERYVGFPDGMELPEIPSGFTNAIYRGLGWVTLEGITYAWSRKNVIAWNYARGKAMGTPDFYYCEFIK